MTDAAIAQRDFPRSGRNDITPTLIPSAILCAVVVATGASFIHWSSRAPVKPPAVVESAPTTVRTWVIERPHLAPEMAIAPDAAALAVATQKLALAAATQKLAKIAAGRVDDPGSAQAESPIRRTVAAAAAPIVSERRILLAKAETGSFAETGAPPPVSAPLPTVSTPGEHIPVPPPRPAFRKAPKDDVAPPSRPAALAPPADDAAQPQRPELIAPPKDEAVAPPREESPRSRRRRLARQTQTSPSATAPEDNRNILEKLFGVTSTPRAAAAYAPQDGGLGGIFGRSKPSYDSQTAIYDIAAHTVYMPDGRRLEAHSGLGQHLDDPRSVNTPNRGATPPNVYQLSLRESAFHGVRALRLNPVAGTTTFGRNGLLAHTFMLGSRGDSNGCVVFRDYDTFLQAYDSGAIKRLAVVSSMR